MDGGCVMIRTVRTIVVALAVPLVLAIIAAAFQYVLYALPYFAIYVLRVENEGAMGAAAWSIWGGGSVALGAIAYALVRRVARNERNRTGAWTGVAAYFVAVVALMAFGLSAEPPLLILASSQVFTAAPVLLGAAAALVHRSSGARATRPGARQVPRRASRSDTRQDPA